VGYWQQLILKLPELLFYPKKKLQGNSIIDMKWFHNLFRLGQQYGLDESETAVAVTYIKEHGQWVKYVRENCC